MSEACGIEYFNKLVEVLRDSIPYEEIQKLIKDQKSGKTITDTITKILDTKKFLMRENNKMSKRLAVQIANMPNASKALELLKSNKITDRNKGKKILEINIQDKFDQIHSSLEGQGVKYKNGIIDQMLDTKSNPDLDPKQVNKLIDDYVISKYSRNSVDQETDLAIASVYNAYMKSFDGGVETTKEMLSKITSDLHIQHVGKILADNKRILDKDRKVTNSGQYTGHVTYERVKAGAVSKENFIDLGVKNVDWEHEAMKRKMEKHAADTKTKGDINSIESRKSYLEKIYKTIERDDIPSLQEKNKFDLMESLREELSDGDDIRRSFVYKDLPTAYEMSSIFGDSNTATSKILQGITSQSISNEKMKIVGQNPIAVIEGLFKHFGDGMDIKDFGLSTNGYLFNDSNSSLVKKLITGATLGDSLNNFVGAYRSSLPPSQATRIATNLLGIAGDVAYTSFLKLYVVKSLSDSAIQAVNKYKNGTIGKAGLVSGVAIRPITTTMGIVADIALTLSSYPASLISPELAKKIRSGTALKKLEQEGLINMEHQLSVWQKMKEHYRERMEQNAKIVNDGTESFFKKMVADPIEKATNYAKVATQSLSDLATITRGQKNDIELKKILSVKDAEAGLSKLIINYGKGDKRMQAFANKYGWTDSTIKLAEPFKEQIFDIDKLKVHYNNQRSPITNKISEIKDSTKINKESIEKMKIESNEQSMTINGLERKIVEQEIKETKWEKPADIDRKKTWPSEKLKEEMNLAKNKLEELGNKIKESKKKQDEYFKEIEKQEDILKTLDTDYSNINNLYYNEIRTSSGEPSASVKGYLASGAKSDSADRKFLNAINQFQSYILEMNKQRQINKNIYEEIGGASYARTMFGVTLLSVSLWELMSINASNHIYNLQNPDSKKKRSILNKDNYHHMFTEAVARALFLPVMHKTVIDTALDFTGAQTGNIGKSQTPVGSIAKNLSRTAKKVRKGEGADIMKGFIKNTGKSALGPAGEFFLQDLLDGK